MEPSLAAPGAPAAAKASSSSSRLLHAAFMLLGIPSFLVANSLWSEMAAFVRALPEGSHSGSYLLVALQAANVVPALAMIDRWPKPLHDRRPSLETAIWLQLAAGFSVCQAISWLWDRTSAVNGQPHAVALIALVFVAGAVNNSSSLLFYPYVARWPRRFITDLAVGEGLSGPLVALLALAQNVGSQRPNFSTRVYYQIVSLLYLPSVAAYVFLRRQEARRAEDPTSAGATSLSGDATPPLEMEVAVHDGGGSGGYYKRMPAGPDPGEASDGEAPPPLLSAPPAANGGGGGGHATSSSAPAPSAGAGAWVVFRRIWSLLAVQFVVAGLAYGVLPAVLPVAVTGYRDAAHVLQYSSFVSMFMDPLARFGTHYVRVYRLAPLFCLVLALAAVIIAAAAAAPHPPLAELSGGGALIVVVNGLFTAAFAFCSTMVYFATHRRAGTGGGASSSDDPLVVASEGHAAGAVNEQPLIVGRDREEGVGGESVAVRVQRQQGFKQAAFTVQAGAFVGALVTWLLVVNTKERS